MPFNRDDTKPDNPGQSQVSTCYCLLCKMEFGTAASLRIHRIETHLACEICSIGVTDFKNRKELDAHYKRGKHWVSFDSVEQKPETNKKASDPQNASLQYGSSSAQRESEASVEEKVWRCPYCSQPYYKKGWFKSHMKTAHPNEQDGSKSNETKKRQGFKSSSSFGFTNRNSRST